MPGVDPMSVMAGVQGVTGAIQTLVGSNKANRLVNQRTPYETPTEDVSNYNMATSMAQNGYDAFSLNYMTNQIDRAGSDALDAATRLNADPDTIATLLDNEMMGYMKVGADNSIARFQKYKGVMDARSVLGRDKEAEWASREGILKDRIAQATGDKAQGFQNLMTGINTGATAYAQQQQMKAYEEALAKLMGTPSVIGSTTLPPTPGGNVYGTGGPGARDGI